MPSARRAGAAPMGTSWVNDRAMPSVAINSRSPTRRSTACGRSVGSWCPTMPPTRRAMSGEAARDEPPGELPDGLLRKSAASTLPTPSQLIDPVVALMLAIVIAAPRVPANAAWHSTRRASTGSAGFSRHQAAGSGQAEAQPLGGGIAVLEGSLHVADAWPVVARLHVDADAAGTVDDSKDDLAPPGIAGDVARHLGDGRGYERQVGTREAD